VVADPSQLEQPGRDRALVEAHCAGDRDVFAVIVKEHYGMLLALAERRLGNRTEAEDAVQEALERAFRALGSFGGEFRLAAWLSRIVTNVCADHGARRLAEQRLPGRLGFRRTVVADVSESTSDPTVLRAVQAALDTLPRSQRNTFLLHALDGLSYPQVADQLGISEDNARARVHRARRTLQRTLDATRSALGGLIAVPLGIRALAGRLAGANRRGSSSSGRGTELPNGASALPALPATANQMAASPIGQVAIAVAANPRGSLMAGLAATLAVVTSVFAGPGSAPSSTAAAVVSRVTPSPAPSGPTPATASSPTTTGASSATAPSAPTSAPSRSGAGSSWIAAGAGGASSPASPGADPLAAPVGSQPCPWATNLGTPSPVDGMVAAMLRTPALNLTPGSSSPVLSTSATIDDSVQSGAGGDSSTSVDLQARVCLPPEQPALVVDVAGPGGEVELSGGLILTTGDSSDTNYIFRGSVSSPAASMPWNLPDRFVALVEVREPANTASLSVAFLGTPDPSPSSPSTGAGSAAPPASPSTPSSSSTTPTTAASSTADPSGPSPGGSPGTTSASPTSDAPTPDGSSPPGSLGSTSPTTTTTTGSSADSSP